MGLSGVLGVMAGIQSSEFSVLTPAEGVNLFLKSVKISHLVHVDQATKRRKAIVQLFQHSTKKTRNQNSEYGSMRKIMLSS